MATTKTKETKKSGTTREPSHDTSDSKPGDTVEDKMDKVNPGIEAVEHDGADADLAEASIKDLTGVATATQPQVDVARMAAQFAQFHAIEGLEDSDGKPLQVVDFSYDSDGSVVAVTETRTRWRKSPDEGAEWTNETEAKAEKRQEEMRQAAKDFKKSEAAGERARDQSLAQTRKEAAKNT